MSQLYHNLAQHRQDCSPADPSLVTLVLRSYTAGQHRERIKYFPKNVFQSVCIWVANGCVTSRRKGKKRFGCIWLLWNQVWLRVASAFFKFIMVPKFRNHELSGPHHPVWNQRAFLANALPLSCQRWETIPSLMEQILKGSVHPIKKANISMFPLA